jgi:hypothetical protein
MPRLGPSAAVVLIAALDALWAGAAADCTCRAQGRNFEQGQTACLATPKGPRLESSGMVLNISSWEFSDSPCTVSNVSMPGVSRSASTRQASFLIPPR